MYSSSSSLSPGAILLCPPGGVAGILFISARDDSVPATVPLASPGLGSAAGGLALLLDRLSPTVVDDADGEVDSRSTFFFGKSPSFATFVQPNRSACGVDLTRLDRSCLQRDDQGCLRYRL